MSANLKTRITDNIITRNGGLVWHRLHSERENICEELLHDSGVAPKEHMQGAPPEVSARTAIRHLEILQSRLRKIDDALDRLMSGSYGICSNCGRSIEGTRLDLDPTIAVCIYCWRPENSQTKTSSTNSRGQRHLRTVPCSDLLDPELTPSLAGVELQTLVAFDTIWVRTLNTCYRIFLLDPRTGRALVEGGSHFAKPAEAMVSGSTLDGCPLQNAWIGIGLRLEMLVDGNLISTSPIQSIRVERHTAGELITTAIQKQET